MKLVMLGVGEPGIEDLYGPFAEEGSAVEYAVRVLGLPEQPSGEDGARCWWTREAETISTEQGGVDAIRLLVLTPSLQESVKIWQDGVAEEVRLKVEAEHGDSYAKADEVAADNGEQASTILWSLLGTGPLEFEAELPAAGGDGDGDVTS